LRKAMVPYKRKAARPRRPAREAPDMAKALLAPEAVIGAGVVVAEAAGEETTTGVEPTTTEEMMAVELEKIGVEAAVVTGAAGAVVGTATEDVV